MEEVVPERNGALSKEDEILANRAKLAQKMGSPNAKKAKQT